MNADTFSTQNLIKLALRFGLGIVALLLLIEVVLWAAFRAPTDSLMTIHLKNNIPGLKPKVTLNLNPDQQLRSINWTSGAKDANTVRILCVGGFATLGQLQNAPDTWWGQLGVLLQEKVPGAKIEIGANGASGMQSLVGARWVTSFAADWQPDIIITNFGAGDVMGQPLEYKYSANAFDTIPSTKRERGGFKNLMLNISQMARWKRVSNVKADAAGFEQRNGEDNHFAELFETMRKDFAKVHPVPNPFRLSDNDPRMEYMDAIKIINTQAKAVGAKLIITGEPCLCKEFLPDDVEALRNTFMPKSVAESHMAVKVQSGWVAREIRRFQEAAEQYATENQLVFCDLNEQVPQDATHFVNETILTDKGAEKAAEILLPKVLPVVQQLLKK